MKKLLLSLLIVFMYCIPVYSAIDKDVQWAINTAGSDVNGCGFKDGATGTDFSDTETTPNLSLTDLAMTTATTTLTSVIGGFAATHVGNLIQITAGTNFTVGFYEITVFTDTNTITIDRDATTGVNASGGTGAIGGACAKPGHIDAHPVAGNKIWIKAGTYTEVTAEAHVLQTGVAGLDGVDNLRIVWEGFNSSRDDTPIGTNRPLFDAGGITFALDVNHSFHTFKNIRMDGATSDCVEFLSQTTDFFNIKVSNCGAEGFDGSSAQFTGVLIEASNCTSDGIEDFSTNLICTYCYFHDNAARGINGDTRTDTFLSFVVAESNSSDGLSSESFYINNSVFYNNTGVTSSGVQHMATTSSGRNLKGFIVSSSSSSNGEFAYDLAEASGNTRHFYFNFNNFFGHTVELNGISSGNNDTGDTDPLFNAPASGDFDVTTGSPLINTAPQLETVIGLGGTPTLNIGVDQDDTVTAGGGTNANGAIMGAF